MLLPRACQLQQLNPIYDYACRLRGFRSRHGIWNIVFCAFIVAALLIMLATAAWGLAEGLKATRHISDDFWAVVAVARTKVSQSITVTTIK